MGLGRIQQAFQTFSNLVVNFTSRDKSSVANKTNETTQHVLHPDNPEITLVKPVHSSPNRESPSLAKRINTLWERMVHYRVPMRLVDNTVVTAISRKIDQFFKDEPKNIVEVKVEVEKGLAKLEALKNKVEINPKTGAKLPHYVTAKEKEETALLTALWTKIQVRPIDVKDEMENAKTDPTSKALIASMGVVRFLAMKAKIEENKVAGRGAYESLQSNHEIALMGYTTGDYRKINNAMRRRKGETEKIQNPDTKTYAKTLGEGLALLPDMTIPKEGLALRRGINVPRGAPSDWTKKLFKEGRFFVDPSFTSTSYGQDVPNATILVTYLPPVGAKTFPHAKQIQDTYSVWPGEKEAIIEPNTPFVVEEFKQEGDKYYVTLRSVDEEVSPANRRRANYWLQQIDS